MKIRLVGVDCATESTSIGLAVGALHDQELFVSWARTCGRKESVAEAVSEWLLQGSGPSLIAIDAPLGWPKPLAVALREHRAGEEISTVANEMFRRSTDAFIRRTIGKTPLDVGADRIARTVLAALRILGELRRLVGDPIPLAWEWPPSAQMTAIEVYSAATLVTHGLRGQGYKKPGQQDERDLILNNLRSVATLPADTQDLRTNPDALDAVVCLLAAKDFLNGEAEPPTDRELARCEGWIWARRPRGRLSTLHENLTEIPTDFEPQYSLDDDFKRRARQARLTNGASREKNRAQPPRTMRRPACLGTWTIVSDIRCPARQA
jgi:hypothetical protein